MNEVLDTMMKQTSCRTLAADRAPAEVQHAFFAAAAVYPLNDPRVHYLDGYSLWDNTIDLHDGSLWKVNSWDMYKIRDWASNDILSISCTEYLFGEKYRITNSVTGQSVLVNLVDGPVLFGPNTHWVVGIDRFLSRVYLEDGTYWDVRFLDQNMLSQWAVNDTIIAGDSNGWWSDTLLINVNMNQHVYAGKGY